MNEYDRKFNIYVASDIMQVMSAVVIAVADEIDRRIPIPPEMLEGKP